MEMIRTSTGTSENPNYTLKRVIYWDPTASTATRPLALNVIQNGAGTLYFPTVDLTKNVCELVDFYGNVAVSYLSLIHISEPTRPY